MSVVTGDVTVRLDGVVGNLIRKARAGGADTCTVLSKVTASLVGHRPEIHHAGITVIEDGDVVRSIAASDGHALVIDNIARRQLTGPGFDAALDEHSYRIDDLHDEDRWPMFAAKAAASTPIRSVLAVPIDTGGTVTAALNLYSGRPDAFDAEIEAIAAVYAGHIGRLLSTRRSRRRATAPKPVPKSVDALDQGKQLLMQRFGVDPAAALSVLIRLSKEWNQSLDDVAHRLIGPRPVADLRPATLTGAAPDRLWREGAA